MESIVDWMQASPLNALLVVVMLGTAVVSLVGVALWLSRRRQRSEDRQTRVDEFRRRVERLGIGSVWQTPLFQADVYGVRGKINDFDLRCEIWDKASRDFFRLSIYFPRSTRQHCRLRSDGTLSVLPGKLIKMDTGDGDFDGVFELYGPEEGREVLVDLFDSDLRGRLLALDTTSDGIRIGDRSFYLYARGEVDPASLERVLKDGLAAATQFFHRAQEVGPSTEKTDMTYEMASADVLGRESGETLEAGGLPEGSDTQESSAPSSGAGGEDGSATAS